MKQRIECFALGVLIATGAACWLDRARQANEARNLPHVYRQDRGAFLFECTVWDGARRVAVVVPISEDYPCYTAPAVVWTLPEADMDKILGDADRIHREGLDCVYQKFSPYVGGKSR